ncbi:MAG: hypothetical protein IKA61_00560 [Clostridia bacterium]|nr:hypothetical protein [Clostridia bacterium]
MKSFMSKFKLLLISCLAIVAIALSALSFIANDKVTADAAGVSLSNGEYSTDGSSIRIFKTADDVEATERTGLRFHVEMGDGYLYNGNPVINTSETNDDNGSYKINDGFVTYTLIIPTRLLDGELSVNTPNVLKLNTSNFWYHDKDNNLESVAYIYNIPDNRYTDMFSFRGVICDSNGNLLAQTSVVERCVAEIARKSYDATIAGTEDWGSPERTQVAINTLLGFIPVFDVIYQDATGDELATERVMWGDAPTSAPKDESFNSWYDTENSTEVDTSKAMHYPNGEVILTATKAEEFNLTGVAAVAKFTVDTIDYHGVKVFATLHREAFANNTKMDTHAVNMEHKRGDEILCDGIELQGVWTLEEQNELGEWQMRLFFGLDTSTLENGDKVIIKGDSVFYANGVMYKLTEDYTIDYTKVNDVEDYGMFLGYLYNSDVSTITNCAEDNTGNNGEPNEFTVRVEFYEDVMINGSFTFEFGAEVDTEEYPYPVFIKCGEDETKLIPINGGRYYWNEGDHKILELIGTGDYENKVFGWHNGDELIAAPGTIIKQNGGYYIFEDEMYGYFLANGNVDKWGYKLGDWVVGTELAQYSASEFATEGSVTETTDYGTLADEIRINTTSHWFGQAKVSIITTEKMLDSAPYAVYCTSKDSTVTEITHIRYHGQSKPEGGNYQILGLCGEGKFTVGDVVTIAAGTRFWLGTEYYTVTEELNYYYTGSFWVQSYDESTMGTLSSASFGDRAHNQGATELRMYFTAPLAGYTTTDGGAFDELRIGTGSIRFNGNPVSYVRYQRWDANSTWLSFGGYSGSVAFGDKLVIEAGTTIWGANKVAYKFTEKVEWIYSGNPADANRTWSRVIGGVTVSATAENASVTGAGTFAVGETYTVNVTPTGDYLVSKVTINDDEKPLNASNTYTFTVAQNNTIKVETVVGHKVHFTIPEGITVDGGTLSNGSFKSVASGGSLTFSVSANEGYKLLGVSGATHNGDGTYTINNVTAETTITISVEKLYRVTYSGENANVTANVSSGAWVDNGTSVTFTISVNSGCTLVGVSNATKVNATTYTATVSGADLNVVATALKNDEFVDITDRIQIEDRAWGVTEDKHAGGSNEVYVGVLDTGITNADGTHYFNTSVNDTWYVGNTAIIEANGGVDIMEYIYVNGVSARKLITDNANGVRNSNACNCWLSNPAAYPVYVETTNGSGLMIRLAKAAFGTEFTITIKAGFRITNAGGELVVVTKDVEFNYNGGTVGRKYSTASVSKSNATISGVVDGQELTNGNNYTFTTSASSGYAITSVTINGVEQGTSGSYSFTASGTKVEIVVTAKKLYAVTWSNPTGATISVTANGSAISSGATVVEGTSISVTATASSGYVVTNVTANGTSIGTTSGTYTVNEATTIAATVKKTYTVTATTSGGVSVDITSKTVIEGESVTFTLTVPTDATIKANGTQISGTSYTVNNVTADTTVTFTTWYTVTVSTSNGASVNGVANGQLVESGTTINFTASDSDGLSSVKINGTSKGTGGSYSHTVTGPTTITVEGKCLVEGTMILMADGTQKAVENIVVGDKVMVFNHETGKYEAGTIWFNDHTNDPAETRKIINLEFANGTKTRIAYEHGFFDLDLMKYVFINADNMHEFIGHRFVTTTYNAAEVVQGETTLVNAYITEEFVKVYGPITEYHFNLVSDDMLSMPSFNFGATGMVNIFDYDEDLSYNEEKMQADIEAYGLFTYEEFAEFMSYEDYCKAPIAYFKVAIGKGNLTWEQIELTLNYLAVNEF